MLIKSKEEIVILREAGRRLATILNQVARSAVPGANSLDLDALSERLIRQGGDVPAFLGYTPRGARRPFPATLCVSVNDEIVHGIPNEKNKELKEGDIVGLDLGLRHNGFYVDMALTVGVGAIGVNTERLLKMTNKALIKGIAAAKSGSRVGDIGSVIEQIGRKAGYGIVRELGGHGVGRAVHEEPYIPNYGKRGRGELLKEGLVLAIEPMFNLGGAEIILNKDGYTYHTKDRSISAHFEHTVLVTKSGGEILTQV